MSEVDPANAYVLMADGRCLHVRPVQPVDWQIVYDLAGQLDDESLARRYPSVPEHPREALAEALCSPETSQFPPTCGALIGFLDGAAVGLADWRRVHESAEAEVELETVSTPSPRDVENVLAEQVARAAQRAGVRRLTLVASADDRHLPSVFAALGMPVRRDLEAGEHTMTVLLDDRSRVERRDVRQASTGFANEAAFGAVFAPRSVALLGEAGEPMVQALEVNLASFPGPVYRGGARGELLPADASLELAVIASPPDDVVAGAGRCADLGAKAVIVTARGFGRESGEALRRVCQGRGMSLVGPGSLGVCAPSPPRQLNALICEQPPSQGHAGVVVQSGGVGLALLSHLHRLDVGVSAFVAVGEKYDMSANDLLDHWSRDEDTRFALLHVESFGNPRNFARAARRLSRRIPVLAVDPERSPSEARASLYAQAGIVALPSLGALVGAAALVEHQPIPQGPRVAVLGTTHGMVSLGVQACANAGLDVTEALDLTPDADAATLAEAARNVLGANPRDATCDCVLIALAPTAPGNLDPTPAAASVREDAVVVAVTADQAESVTVRPIGGAAGRGLPSFDDATDAARSLAALVQASEVQRRPEEAAGRPYPAELPVARRMVGSWAEESPEGRELEHEEAEALLAAVGAECAEQTNGSRFGLTAWQDPAFGPLVTVVSNSGRLAGTALAPVGPSEASALVHDAAGEEGASAADLVRRVSSLIDACPAIASLTLDAVHGSLGTTAASVAVQLEAAPRAGASVFRLSRAAAE